ncbi:MAG: hypothetical protein ACI915_003507 [Gammaproteobacteria bacterium]
MSVADYKLSHKIGHPDSLVPQHVLLVPFSCIEQLLLLIAHLLAAIAKRLGPGGAKTVIAESLIMKPQLLVVSRSRRRVPNLSAVDRFLLGFWSLFLSARHRHYSIIDDFKISRHPEEAKISMALLICQ